MTKLGDCAPKPRSLRVNPRYPRCIAALAVVASMNVGCKEPDVALAGDVAPVFEDAGAKTTPTTAPTASEREVVTGGVAPQPFAPSAPSK